MSTNRPSSAGRFGFLTEPDPFAKTFMNAIGVKPVEYAFGILHWLGNRTYRPGTYSVNLHKLTHKGFIPLPYQLI